MVVNQRSYLLRFIIWLITYYFIKKRWYVVLFCIIGLSSINYTFFAPIIALILFLLDYIILFTNTGKDIVVFGVVKDDYLEVLTFNNRTISSYSILKSSLRKISDSKLDTMRVSMKVYCLEFNDDRVLYVIKSSIQPNGLFEFMEGLKIQFPERRIKPPNKPSFWD